MVYDTPSFFTAIFWWYTPLAPPVTYRSQRPTVLGIPAPLLRAKDEGGEERRRARFRTQQLQPILRAPIGWAATKIMRSSPAGVKRTENCPTE